MKTVDAGVLWCLDRGVLLLVCMPVEVSSLPTLREGEEFTDANGNAPSATASTRTLVGGQKRAIALLSGRTCSCCVL
jgi:hypothetical protein